MKHAMANAKAIKAPISVSGFSTPLANALTKAAAMAGAGAGGAAGAPRDVRPQTLQPGSAVAVGYSNGDVRPSSVGTVTYVDGDRVLILVTTRGRRRRALLLQDASTSGSSTTRCRSARWLDLQAQSRRGMTWARSPATASARSPARRPLRTRFRSMWSRATRTQSPALGQRARPTRPPSTCPAAGRGHHSSHPLAVSQAAGRRPGQRAFAAQAAICAPDRVVAGREAAGSCNRYISTAAAGRGRLGRARCAERRRERFGGALASIDAFTGKPPTVTASTCC